VFELNFANHHILYKSCLIMVKNKFAKMLYLTIYLTRLQYFKDQFNVLHDNIQLSFSLLIYTLLDKFILSNETIETIFGQNQHSFLIDIILKI
jgi:hypothetical protein